MKLQLMPTKLLLMVIYTDLNTRLEKYNFKNH